MTVMRVKVTLTVIEGKDFQKTHQVNKSPYVIGRAKSDFSLSDGKVSSKHAHLIIDGKKVWLKDLDSRNGTQINGLQIEKRLLHDLDVIEMGFTKIQVNIVENLQALQKSPVDDDPTKLVKDIGILIEDELDKFSKWDLSNPGSKIRNENDDVLPLGIRVVKGPDKGKVFPFPKKKKVVMGRGQVDFVLKDSETSRMHAQIEIMDDGQVMVKDLNSTNGTWYKGERIDQQIIVPGEYIQIGHTVCELYVEPSE